MKPCEFQSLDDNRSSGFVLRPGRSIMPFTWIVEEPGSRQRYGTLKRKVLGKVDWKLHDAKDRQVAVFKGQYKRRFWLIRLIDVFMGGSLPYRYDIISNGKILAAMDREERPDSNTKAKEKKGLIAKLINRVLVDKDWVIREADGKEGKLDHRLVLSGAILLDQISRDVSAPE